MKIITIIGADACGKDTQIELLKKHYEKKNLRVQVITIWDSLKDFSNIENKQLLQEIVETFLLKFVGDARSFFLLSCLYNSAAKLDPKNDIILFNGFYHKYWASEMSYGVGSTLWEKNISGFVASDKVFFLNTPLEECLKRKTKWSRYEQGSELAEFQQKLHGHLERIALGIPDLVTLDGSKSIEEVHADILKKL